MADEIKLRHALERAAQAEVLKRNELLQEAFAYLEKRYIEEWAMSQFRDHEARERLWMAVNVNRKYKDHLQAVISNGVLAQAELNQLSGLNKAA